MRSQKKYFRVSNNHTRLINALAYKSSGDGGGGGGWVRRPEPEVVSGVPRGSLQCGYSTPVRRLSLSLHQRG